jgi:squalene cyclase
MRKKIIVLMLLLAASPLPLLAQDLFSQNEDVIPPELDRTYTKAMQYLVKTQSPDGSWPGQYGTEPAVVSLAMLSILAHGEDPNYGPYHATIHRCIDFLLKSQNSNTGYIGSTMYNHGFSTLALAESYGMVQDPRLGPALQKAVDLILTSQAHNPENAWRYSPESPDADTTVSGAQMVALFAARNAGIGVPEDAINKALKFFASCQTPDGGIGYTGPGGPNGVRTSIGCLVFALAKQEKSAAYRGTRAYLKTGAEDQGPYHEYYLYYTAQAMFRGGPSTFDAWNAENIKTLTHTQTADGSWSGQLGPTFSTAASLLSLALNYRLLPIYER